MAAILSTLLLVSSVLGHRRGLELDFDALTPAAIMPRQTASALPLTDYTYTYPNVPYQVNPYPSGRGPQSGYNICNSTTEGPTSLCQTMFVNSIDDFCLWGSPTSDGLIGNVEAQVVAYCTKPGHGTRVMPPGTLTNVQFMRTSGYIQVTGQFNQQGIGLDPTDYGGELDPHGADLAGNPLGGLVFSNALPSSKNVIIQGQNWSNFVGSGLFCIKVCDPTVTSPDYCQNIFDLVGCSYNMPSSAYTQTGTFTDCEGDLQMEPGLYVENGVTMTWQQPESLSSGYVMPWTPTIPASSACTTYTSSVIYAAANTPGASSIGGGSAAASHSGTGPTKATGKTASGAQASSTSSSGAMTNGIRAGAVLGAVAGALIVLA